MEIVQNIKGPFGGWLDDHEGDGVLDIVLYPLEEGQYFDIKNSGRGSVVITGSPSVTVAGKINGELDAYPAGTRFVMDEPDMRCSMIYIKHTERWERCWLLLGDYRAET